jgi:hypothetical protein
MKKLFALTLSALIVCAAAMAQEPEKKKRGGFLRGLAKVVESSTGLNVSKEAVFVYEEMGKFKVTMVSCVGDPATGRVVPRLAITKLFGDNTNPNRTFSLEWVKVSGTNSPIPLGKAPWPHAFENHYDMVSGQPVEFEFDPAQAIMVPADTPSIDLRFFFNADGGKYNIEARDMPITWVAAE